MFPTRATRAVISKGRPGKEPAILVSADGTLTLEEYSGLLADRIWGPASWVRFRPTKMELSRRHRDRFVLNVTFDSAEHYAARQHKIWSFGAELSLIGEDPPTRFT